jgi:hypothetical protein
MRRRRRRADPGAERGKVPTFGSGAWNGNNMPKRGLSLGEGPVFFSTMIDFASLPAAAF